MNRNTYNEDLQSALLFISILKTKSLNVDEKITLGIIHGMHIQKQLDDSKTEERRVQNNVLQNAHVH